MPPPGWLWARLWCIILIGDWCGRALSLWAVPLLSWWSWILQEGKLIKPEEKVSRENSQWPLHQFLPADSCLVWVPALTSNRVWPESCKPFTPQGFWLWCFMTPIENWTKTLLWKVLVSFVSLTPGIAVALKIVQGHMGRRETLSVCIVPCWSSQLLVWLSLCIHVLVCDMVKTSQEPAFIRLKSWGSPAFHQKSVVGVVCGVCARAIVFFISLNRLHQRSWFLLAPGCSTSWHGAVAHFTFIYKLVALLEFLY